MQEIIDVNVYQVGAMLGKLTKKLDRRADRHPCGVIIVSSIGAQHPMPFYFIYQATKVFEKYLALALDYENKLSGRNIDMLCL